MPSRTFTRRLVDQMIWANIFLRNFFSQIAVRPLLPALLLRILIILLTKYSATESFTKTSRLISSQPGVHKKPLWHFVLYYSKIPLYSCSDLKMRKKSMRDYKKVFFHPMLLHAKVAPFKTHFLVLYCTFFGF